MRNPFKRKAITASSDVLATFRQGSVFTLLGGGARERVVEAFQTAKTANYAWMYQNSPAVRTVVDTITRNIGQLDLRLYEEVSESERQPQPDHPAALSLRYPSETVTSDQFIRQLFTDYLTAGDAVAVMQPGTGSQLTFKWVPIAWVQFLSDNPLDTNTYRITNTLNGVFVDYPADSILHWRGENPHDPRIGLSHLESLRGVIAEDAAIQQATVELAQSGLPGPIAIKRPLEAPEWSNTVRDAFDEWAANKIAASNKRPWVLEEGMEPISFGVSPRDAQMLEVRRWIISLVAAAFGVPGPMVGLDGDLEKAQSSFYSDTLPPYCEEFTRFLNQRVCVRAYNDTSLCFEFNLDEKHMGDDRISSLVSGSGRAVFTTNEARAKLNLPPIDTGDELVTPLNVIVGENPQPSPHVLNPADPQGQPRGVAMDQQPKALIKADMRPVQLHTGRAGDLERQHRNIDLASAVFARHYQRLSRSLQSKAAADWSKWDQRLSDDLDRYLSDIVEKEGTIYAFKLGGHFDPTRVRNYLRAMAEGTAKGVNDTIRGEITEFGIDGALGLRDRHIESAGAGLGAAATTWAREEAARQSPQIERRVKTWIPDTARHAEFGGDTVPIGADWPAGFAPGTAPGCRCTYAID